MLDIMRCRAPFIGSHPSNDGEFVGLIDPNIKYALLTGVSSDYVLVDDLARSVAVCRPSSCHQSYRCSDP
jgi:hypothetical protein